MTAFIGRRELATLIGGAAVWPLVAGARQAAIPVIGYLSIGSPESDVVRLTGIRQGLKESGYVEGQGVAIEYRFAQSQYDRLPALATDLVGRQVAGIVAVGTPSTLAAKSVTSTVPIVFNIGVDPVQFGLVASLNRPGGNVTGVVLLTAELGPKRLELLHQLLLNAAVVAMLINPANRVFEPETSEMQNAARSRGLQLHILRASTVSEIDSAFEKLVELRVGGLVIGTDPFFTNQRIQIVALAARHAVPTIYGWREFPAAGGLMSYGTSLFDSYRKAGIYAGMILKGATPADLPVQQVVKIELVINLKTAKSLSLKISPTLLARADEVIE